MRIPIVVWGAGAVPRTRAGGRGRDVGPTIASLLGIGPLSHATGRPLVPGDVATGRQRTAARMAVRAAGTSGVEHVPLALPIIVVALLILAAGSGLEIHPLMASPAYALVFACLLVATHTLSFSVSNDPAAFGVRVTTLSALAALAQLRLGGRSSLVPAALVASLAVLGTAAAAAHQPMPPSDGTLCFLPIPALGSLAFVCLMTAAIGRPGVVRVRTSVFEPAADRRPVGDALATDVPLAEADVVQQIHPELGAWGGLAYAGRIEGTPFVQEGSRSIAPAIPHSRRSRTWQLS